MTIEGKHECYCCSKSFEWKIILKGDDCETVSNRMDQERGIPTFIGKNKVQIEVNCPSCHNVNKFNHKIK